MLSEFYVNYRNDYSNHGVSDGRNRADAGKRWPKMIGDPAARAIDSEIDGLQRIIDADEAILQHEKSQEKRSLLIAEIDDLQDKIVKLRNRRQAFVT